MAVRSTCCSCREPRFSFQYPETAYKSITLTPGNSVSFDVGFPSVCCEYILLASVNKEAPLAYGRANTARQKIQARTEKERR